MFSKNRAVIKSGSIIHVKYSVPSPENKLFSASESISSKTNSSLDAGATKSSLNGARIELSLGGINVLIIGPVDVLQHLLFANGHSDLAHNH